MRPRAFLSFLMLLGGCFFVFSAVSWAQQAPKVTVDVLAKGEGQPVKEGDKVAVSYKLSLQDGTFIEKTPADGSYDMVIGSDKVIPGLSQGVEGMLAGERRKLTIPAQLAYGPKGSGKIPPNATLVFEVELLYTLSHASAQAPGHEGHSHSDGEDMFGEDGSLNRPTANQTTDMAMMEYMTREFFTSAWRLPHANLRIWKKTGAVLLCLLVLQALDMFLSRRGLHK